MTDIALGPLVFPIRLLLLGAAGAAALLAGRWRAGGAQAAVERALWILAGCTLLAARLAFVLHYRAFYRDDPLALLDIRDGGFDAVAGLAAAVAGGLALAWRRPHQRAALLLAVGAACAAWLGGTSALARWPNPAALPPAVLVRLDGTPLALADLRGRPVVLNLWASWCPPCRREMPVLAQAQRARPDVVFVFANQGEPPAVIRRYLAAQGLALENVVLDSGGQLARASEARGLPTTLFYTAPGRLADRRSGELSSATLQHGLEALGAAPRPSSREQ